MAIQTGENEQALRKILDMTRLSSPQLYYVLSGNDFNLDINNPDEPKIVCMGNNPQKIQTYGAVLSLYVTRLIRLVNKKDKLKSSLVFDEFPTIYLNNMDSPLATARGDKISTCLGIDNKIELKTFHCEIINDHEALKRKQESYQNIEIIRKLDNSMVQRNYLQIKQDVQDIIQSEMERLLNDPGLAHLVVRKGDTP